MDTLSIRTTDGVVEVPCRMPDAVTFEVFLPSRGIRKFSLFLTSRNVADAEISDVVLADAETDPRLPSGFDLDEDEVEVVDEVAGDMMVRFGEVLGQRVTRHSTTYRTSVLDAIAGCYAAELAAYEADAKAWVALHGKESSAFHPTPDPRDERVSGYVSGAARMLAVYVERCMDEVVKEMGVRAREAQAEHSRETEGDSARAGSEAGYTGRGIGPEVTL